MNISSIKSKRINFLDMNRQELQTFFLSIGEKKFRADQVMKWIYHYFCSDFYQMTDIGKNLRDKLKDYAEIQAPELIKEHISSDGTIKWSVKIGEQQVETVFIPENKRATLCISSQVGCALRCAFCATGQQGFNRNLRVSEIVGQIWRAKKILNQKKINNYYPPITNVVIMGMGEPLLNFNNIVSAISIMLDNMGFHLSRRHITLSTSGIAPAIKKLINKLDIKLAISLHAPNDTIRNLLMPINRKYNISSVLSAVNSYLNQSINNKGLITIEYVMLDHINDDIEHAYQLASRLETIPCKINLIPWNSFPGSYYKTSSRYRIHRFAHVLIQRGLITTIRKNRGEDIGAACGQLVGKVLDRTSIVSEHTRIKCFNSH